MANRHSFMWRKPGRRTPEREKFRRLMEEVEAIRLRDGMTKKAVAAEIGTTKEVLRSWLAGQSIGRAESVAKIQQFIKRRNAHLAPILESEPGHFRRCIQNPLS